MSLGEVELARLPETLFTQTLPLVGGFLLCLLLLACFFLRLARAHAKSSSEKHSAPRLLHKRQRGVATSVDFVLTLPIFMFMMFALLQFALLINGSLMVHYAAYSAARAAKAHVVNMDHAFWELECCYVEEASVAGALLMGKILAFPDQDTQDRVFTAAAFQLVTLAPSAQRLATGRTPSVSFDEMGMRTYFSQIEGAGSDRTEYFMRKAAYAFDRRYSRVSFSNPVSRVFEFESESDIGDTELIEKLKDVQVISRTVLDLAATDARSRARAIATLTAMPVQAEVEFRFPLLVYGPARLFHQPDNSVPDNDLGRWLTATVELL